MRSICLKWHDFDLITVMRLMEYWIMNIDYQATETITMARDFFYLVSYIYVKIGRDVWNLYWRLNYSNSVRNKKEELLVLLYAWFSLDSIRIHSIAYYVTTTTLLLTKTKFFWRAYVESLLQWSIGGGGGNVGNHIFSRVFELSSSAPLLSKYLLASSCWAVLPASYRCIVG